MRRWNGWGDEDVLAHPPDAARRMLEEIIGQGAPTPDATFADICAAVPASRLPDHRLIVTGADVRVRHARGQSCADLIALNGGCGLVFPDGVAYPASEADVRLLLDFAKEHDVSLIPYGGGTSVVGHVNPEAGSRPVLTMNLERLAGLRSLDAESRLATFGAGTRGPEVESSLSASGFTLGHFPQSFEYSTLGGWITTRSSGQQSLGYGRIESLFAGGTMFAPRGELRLAPVPASAAGPDLRQLVLGSEGRLGVLTEAIVRVTPRPERERFDGVFFRDWNAALAAARALAQSRLPLSMVRVSTPAETATNLALAGATRGARILDRLLRWRGMGDQRCMAVIGASGSARHVRRTVGDALALVRHHGGAGVGAGGALGGAWRRARFRAPYLRNALWDMGYAVDTVETATTWIRLPQTLRVLERVLHGALEADGERVHVFSHLSHVYPTGSSIYTTCVFRRAADPAATLERWRRLKDAASAAIAGEGATISHHHGVGSDHAPYLEAEKGALGIEALERLVRAFDERGIMNPGKLLTGLSSAASADFARVAHRPS